MSAAQSADAVVRSLGRAAETAATGAVAAALDTLARRAAAGVPGAVVAVDGDAVRVTAAGLVARAFGSRQRAADPRVLALVSGDGA